MAYDVPIPVEFDITDALRQIDELKQRMDALTETHGNSDDPRMTKIVQRVSELSLKLDDVRSKMSTIKFDPSLMSDFEQYPIVLQDMDNALIKLGRQAYETAEQLSKMTRVRSADAIESLAQKDPAMFKSEYIDMAKQFGREDVAATAQEYLNLNNRISECRNEIKMTEQDFKTAQQQMKDVTGVTASVQKISDTFGVLEQRANQLSSVDPVKPPKAAEETIRRTNDNTRSVVNSTKMWKSALAGVTSVLGGIKGIFASLKSGVNKVTSAFKSMRKSSTGTLNDMSRGFKRGLRTLVKYLFGVRSIFFLYRRLRQAATEYLGEMSKQIPAVNKQMSSIKQSMNQMKGSLATAIQPLLNVLVPILKTISEWVTNIADKVASFFALLTGQKVIYHATAGAVDYAESLDKTGKSADKAKKKLESYLSPIDEINKLQAQKEDEDAGSDSGSGGSVSYETIPVDESVLKFLERLKEMWEKGNFYELGKEIGEKLKEVLESIPWDKIRDTANKLGKSFATLLNGFLEVEGLGYDIGNTVAQALNTVFELVNGFVHNFHWGSLGTFIAEAFNGLFEGIDWELIKDTVLTGLDGVYQTFSNFIRDFHWDNISDFISNGVNLIAAAIRKIFDHPLDLKDKGFSSSIENYEPRAGVWTELGRNLGEQLRKTIEKIDWEMLGRAFGSVLQSAIDFLKSLLDEQNFPTLKKAAQDLLEGIFKTVDKEDLALVITGIVGAALLKALAPKAFPWLVTKGASLVKSAFKAKDATQAGTEAANAGAGGFKEGLRTALTNFRITEGGVIGFSMLWDDWCAGTFLDWNMWEGAVKKIVDWLGILWNNIVMGVGNIVTAIGYATGLLFTAPVDWAKGLPTGTTLGEPSFLGEEAFQSFEKYNEAVALLEEHNKSISGSYDEIIKRAERLREELDGTAENMTENAKITKHNYFDPLEESSNSLYGTMTTNTQNTIVDVTDMSTKTREETARMGTAIKVNTETAGKSIDALGRTVETEGYEMPKNFSDAGAKMDYTCGTIEKSFNDTNKNVSKSADDMQTNVGKSADEIKKTFDKDKWNLTGIKDGLAESFENAIRRIKDIWNGFADWLNSKLEINIDTSSFIGEKIASLIGGSRLSLGHIPRLAQGAVIPPNKEFMAVLGDQRNGTNIETPLSTMVDAFNQALAQNGSGQKVTLNLILPDKRTIAQYAIEGGQVLQMSRGRNPFLLEKG